MGIGEEEEGGGQCKGEGVHLTHFAWVTLAALLPDHGYVANASRGVSVYSPALAGTHCTYPRRDG